MTVINSVKTAQLTEDRSNGALLLPFRIQRVEVENVQIR